MPPEAGTEMKLLLLTVGLGVLCFLQITAEVPTQPDFDLQKFAGNWFPISAVSDYGQVKDYTTYEIRFEPGENKKLLGHIEFPIKDKKCRRKKFRLPQGAQPGQYMTPEKKLLQIVETDYSTYVVFYRDNEEYRVLELYARTPEPTEAASEKFKSHVASLGFPVENIARTNLAAPCSEPKIT
ncbi:epididymal secretory protein 4-like [Pogona vitticeps]